MLSKNKSTLITTLKFLLLKRLAKLNLQKQKEKEELEKRLQEEKRARFALESQLSQQEQQTTSSLSSSSKQKQRDSQSPPINNLNTNHSKSNGSDEELKRRIRELENENSRLGHECRSKQERLDACENSELASLSKYKEAENRAESLTAKLCLVQEKNASLQESLSAETRFKMDLFSALGEARRQLEYANCKFWAIFFF